MFKVNQELGCPTSQPMVQVEYKFHYFLFAPHNDSTGSEYNYRIAYAFN